MPSGFSHHFKRVITKYLIVVYYRIRKAIMSWAGKVVTVVTVYYLCMVFSAWALLCSLVKFLWHGKAYFRVQQRSTPPLCLQDPRLGKHHYITLQKVKIHYVENGDKTKPLLLLVHGFPEFWYSWRYQLQEFSQDYWVVAVDLRGYGDSDKPEGKKNYRISALVQDLKEIIEGLGKESCILVAHDWGGLLAWQLTMDHPEMIEKLIILNAPHPAAFRRHIRNSLKQLFMSSYIFCFQAPLVPEILLRSNDLEIFDKLFRKSVHDKEAFTNEDIEAYKYIYSQPGAFTPPLNYYRNLISGLNQPAKTTKISTPILIVWGMKDVALDQSMAEMSAEHCENCVVKMVPNASHWVQQDAYQLVNDTMREFLNVRSSLSRGLVRRMRNMKKQLVSSVSGVMKLGGMIRTKGKLAKTGNFLFAAASKQILNSSFNLLCGISGVPAEALHGFVMLN